MRQSRKILSACMALALCLTPLGAGADAAPQASSYNPTVGIWYSTWYAKEGPYLWIDGHGYGSVGQFLEDVNGDGKDDAVICFETATGMWRCPPARASAAIADGERVTVPAPPNG